MKLDRRKAQAAIATAAPGPVVHIFSGTLQLGWLKKTNVITSAKNAIPRKALHMCQTTGSHCMHGMQSINAHAKKLNRDARTAIAFAALCGAGSSKSS